MMLPQGPRGRLVALGLLLIPVILLARFVVWPLVTTYASSGSALEATRDQIARYQRLLNELPALKAAVTDLERNNPLDPYLLTGMNRALAAADLQRRLQEAAEKHGVTILSLRVRPPVTEAPLERIAVEARLRADIRPLRDLLYYVETTTPYMFVEDLGINVRRSRRARTAPTGLEVNLTLYGLRTPDQTGTTGGAHG
jgi:general secretion pathway protein M